ncbi:aminopeptidase P family protein [Cytobacillus solani]|uniref:Xaa-Pro aminopeptidase n=1 Tax=Cytobacillus solani TaxID=1637975 RepID=A0A0Q3VH67_9BACI|nr:aminopeptidase P family protein [Cytobacillus solani]KOP82490.1 peptidase M24 [Bacillus sp. FJAT-21945]KQL19499.1 peptidase M24 [Cytobacillus solani]USK52722.1 aminopeptidase P family protein [Cytobacillus solani]
MHKDFFITNRNHLYEELKDQFLLVLFAGKAPQKSADEAYKFVPNRNFYYNTGIDEPNIIFMARKKGSKVEEFLFIEKSDPILEKWVGKSISISEAIDTSGIDNILYLDQFESTVSQTLISESVFHVYLDLERRELDSSTTKAQQFASKIQANYPYVQINNVYPAISELRVYKTPEEIEKIKKAIEITQNGIRNVMKHAKPGMKEYQLEAHFDFILNTEGVREHAFPTIVASGKNGTVLHYEKNNALVEDDRLVLLDLGAQFEYYNADISYTFPVNGKFTEKQKVYYNIVLKALRETTALIKPGVPFANLNEMTKKILAEECMKVGLIKEENEISEYYYHGVSHFLGLDTHDVGSYKDLVLQPGMVLTVEPGLYIADEEIGIRIEDDVLVTEEGHEVLTKDIIRSIEDIEAFMQK